MMEELLFKWIANNGFAMAIAVYLLVERYKVTGKLINVLDKTETALDTMNRNLKEREEK